MTRKYIQHTPPTKQLPQTPAIGNFLDSRNLHYIVTKARQIKAISEYIQNTLAPKWATYYHVLNLNGNTLIIATSNSAMASKLQLVKADWLYALRQAHWPDLAAIKIKLQRQ